jgi:syntaxin 5
MPTSRTDSPLYSGDSQQQRNASANNNKPYQITSAARSDILSLDMPDSGSSALSRAGGASAQQLMMLEEGAQSNSYIQERGNAIDQIERTMVCFLARGFACPFWWVYADWQTKKQTELGGIFSQLAQMVSEQGEQIQRIDADTVGSYCSQDNAISKKQEANRDQQDAVVENVSLYLPKKQVPKM